MIPKLIHQTWKSHEIPARFANMVATWRSQNPGWEYRFWSDEDLDTFVADFYPEFLDIFRGYANGVQRADAGRYLILHHFGGVYSDIDTTCESSFDILADDNRIIVCEEPPEHWVPHARARGLNHLIFNGTLASPRGHPFWPYLLQKMALNKTTENTLDSTGPLLLTGCIESYGQTDQFSINSCQLFCPIQSSGSRAQQVPFGDYRGHALSTHHWAGTWYTKWRANWLEKLESYIRHWHYLATRGRFLSPERARATVNLPVLLEPLPALTGHEKIACLIPVRNAVPHLARCMQLLWQLDYPLKNIDITFCEGDSTDDTAEVLAGIVEANRNIFRSIGVVHKTVGTQFDQARRWLPAKQRERRGGLAAVRNHLIATGIKPDSDWVLWIDVDVSSYPDKALKLLLNENEKIVVPHCLKENGGGVGFDLNSFSTTFEYKDAAYFRNVRHGLYQPPLDFGRRVYMHDVRYLHRLPLNGVGGTMLLVHASVHRAGVCFPEVPYCNLIETEGFGQWARDLGVTPVGLPNLEITHPDS